MSLHCPRCKTEEVSVVVISYKCKQGHNFSEEVELPGTPTEIPPEPPMMRFTRPGPAVSSGLRMPFGKHKGELLEDLPTDYIRWCLENLERLDEPYRREMENQLTMRSGGGVVR